jgi:hypothetical protein
MSHSAAPKRNGSPICSGRALKAPRLGELVTKDDLVAEVQKLKEGLETLRNDLSCQSEEARKDAAVTVKKTLEECSQQCASNTAEVRALFNENSTQQQIQHGVLMKEISVLESHSTMLKTALERQKEEIIATITQQHQVALNKLDIRGIVQEALAVQEYSGLVDILDVQGSVQAAFREQARLEVEKAPLLPGQDGYLAQCVAPAHWASAQKAYEEMLFRAASLHINTLDDNDHGCWEDGDAMEVVNYKYPGFSQYHMKMALHHAHVHHYGRLFGQAHNPRPGSGWPIDELLLLQRLQRKKRTVYFGRG